MKIICYGDSNTYGYDPRLFGGGRYEPDCIWVNILREKTKWNIINDGMNGREIPHREEYFPDDADLLIVMLGTNDLLQCGDSEKVASRMEHYLQKQCEKTNQILLLAPPPMKLGEWVPDNHLVEQSYQLAERYKALAENMIIRFYSPPIQFILAYDGVHFTEDDHKRFAEALYHELNRIVELTVF